MAVLDNLNKGLCSPQVITEVTMLKNEGDSFVIDEIDSQVKFVVANLFAASNSLLDSMTIPVDVFKSLPYIYFNINDGDYKTTLDLKSKTATMLGTSAKAYGVRLSIIGY